MVSHSTWTNGERNGSRSSLPNDVLLNINYNNKIINSKSEQIETLCNFTVVCFFLGALSHLNCLKIVVLPMLLGTPSLLPVWVVEICICQLQEVLHLQNLKGWHDISSLNCSHTQMKCIIRRSHVKSSFKFASEDTIKLGVHLWVTATSHRH